MNKDCTILVLSCDKYADLWEPFFKLFARHWPDCPYPVVLGSNTVSLKDKRIKTILSGPDKDWSTSLRLILQQIETPYIFLWLDDIFPIDRVSSEDFAHALSFLKKQGGVHMHMWPTPPPDEVVSGGRYGMYKKGAPYRVNALGFWKVSVLQELLLPGENPWNFEIMGSYRSSYMDGFYCTMKDLFTRLHVVEKGKIFRDAHDYAKRQGISLSTSGRAVASGHSFVKSQLQKYVFNIVLRISWSVRLACMNQLRKLLLSY